ncbi:MAG: hypothetical protein Q9228_003448, partial [Teloschistes exilis]
MTAELLSSLSPELLWSKSASTRRTFTQLRLMDEAFLSPCSILTTMRLDTFTSFTLSAPSTPLSCTIPDSLGHTTTQTLKHKHFIAHIHPTPPTSEKVDFLAFSISGGMTTHRQQHLAPATTGPYSSPAARPQHAGEAPTLLTTTFGAVQNHSTRIASGSETPLSATTLSTPFSPFLQSSAYPRSLDPRDSSPMATRTQTSFNAPYNPQQWGPLSNSTSSPLDAATRSRHPSRSSRFPNFAPRLMGPDEPVASPPPPYSPRRDANHTDSPRHLQSTTSPSETISPMTDYSRNGTPISAATTMSPDTPSCFPSGRSPPPRPYRQLDSHTQLCAGTSFPPPPPAANQSSASRVRSSSRSHAERLLSSLGSKSKVQHPSPPTSAIDALQANTAEALGQTSDTSTETPARPPASRRAASTGGIGLSGHSSRTTSRSPSQARWTPGMPLPPPPPGPPPPAAARSQSLNRSSEQPSADHLLAPAQRSRRPPGTGTALAPVPPTPADWTDEVPKGPNASLPASTTRSQTQLPLHIDTGNILRNDISGREDASAIVSTNPYSAHIRRDPSCGALTRSPAVRDRSAKGIRERRSESRKGMARVADSSSAIQSSTITVSPDSLENVRPTDLVLPVGSSGFSRRRILNSKTPTSGKSVLGLDETLNSPPTQESPDCSRSTPSSNATPQHLLDQLSDHANNSTPTPVFSPSRVTFAPLVREQVSHASAAQSLSSLDVPLLADERPISHLLHIPNCDESMQEPLLPSAQKGRSTQKHRQSTADLLGPESPKAFALRAIERHRIFAEREAATSSDSERLDLFVRFTAAESRIRREQYAAVFAEEEVSISELCRGMFESRSGNQRPGETQHTPELANQAAFTRDSRASSMSDSVSESNWHRSSSVASRNHESPISISTDCSSQNRPESSWWNDYVPCLSPIASMSIVTGQDHDEAGSRGRASSRWWEDQSGESVHGDAFSVLKKSKRESKYMGVPKEARNSPALFETRASGPSSHLPGYGEGPSQYQTYGSNEYPLEKVVGWHQQSSSLPPPPAHPPTPMSAPYTPDPRKLDISRFVTLPPPYPRHHPAVNNSHPDLADVRAVVRSLHKTEEADSIRNAYTTQMSEKRQRANSWRQHQRSLHDQDMKFRMDHEELTQSEFDAAESELSTKLHKSEKETAQADFDLFQTIVVSPLHSLFADRITKANSTIEELSSSLFSDAQKPSPNSAQEEGDEQPELLEKLTQLKWLFEARESLHRQTYDLLTERNGKYRAIVLLPYQQSSNEAKYEEAASFFESDAQDRGAEFASQEAARYEAFLHVIEANVTRGVEIQLSAFWDIAPPLSRVLARVPENLQALEIQIPAEEYAENPAYHEHPLQYLCSLLAHAQRATYQFIESQVNLLCLLHEIKNAAVAARWRRGGGGGRDERGKREEEGRLTRDLKEK